MLTRLRQAPKTLQAYAGPSVAGALLYDALNISHSALHCHRQPRLPAPPSSRRFVWEGRGRKRPRPGEKEGWTARARTPRKIKKAWLAEERADPDR